MKLKIICPICKEYCSVNETNERIFIDCYNHYPALNADFYYDKCVLRLFDKAEERIRLYIWQDKSALYVRNRKTFININIDVFSPNFFDRLEKLKLL